MFNKKVPAIKPDDTPRVRSSDPIESHEAADRSSFTITRLKSAVLELVRENPLAIGSELNEKYKDVPKDRAHPRAAWDSPRKRAGELAEHGYLLVQPSRNGERSFIISARGLDVIA
jgi:hypothetical protein